MTTAKQSSSNRIVNLTQEDGRAILNAHTYRTLGLSADEFIRAWDAGAFDNPDPDTRPEIMWLAMMIPLAR